MLQFAAVFALTMHGTYITLSKQEYTVFVHTKLFSQRTDDVEGSSCAYGRTAATTIATNPPFGKKGVLHQNYDAAFMFHDMDYCTVL